MLSERSAQFVPATAHDRAVRCDIQAAVGSLAWKAAFCVVNRNAKLFRYHTDMRSKLSRAVDADKILKAFEGISDLDQPITMEQSVSKDAARR